MWFRKHLAGRKLGELLTDWPNRRLAFTLSPGTGSYLLISLSEGISLQDALPEGFGDEPQWPTLADVLHGKDIWRSHPQVSPPLRNLLSALPEGRAEAVYNAVQRSGFASFYCYESTTGGQVLPWKLPAELARGTEEYEFASAMEAADHHGRTTLFPYLEEQAQRESTLALKRERKRIKSAIKSVHKDKERLQRMVRMGADGEALRGVLYQYGKGDKLAQVDVYAADGTLRPLKLDARLTVRENMDRLFHKAAKGRRGLEFIEARLAELHRQAQDLDNGVLPQSPMPKERKPAARTSKPAPPKDVAAFQTSDGFTAYRGKNAQGNRQARLMGKPYDLWFHVHGGPGAHVVLRRDYPDQHIPESSIYEAATLAAVKSHAAKSGQADVMVAMVKHVKSMKGMGPGKVTVNQTVDTVSVTPDPEIEARLAIS